MSVIERWTIWSCPECGEWLMTEHDRDAHDCNVYQADAPVAVEVVRDDAYRGAVALLREVAQSGIEFDDERIGYVTVQIDRATWDALAAHRGGSSR
jgi:hypothetical protein